MGKFSRAIAKGMIRFLRGDKSMADCNAEFKTFLNTIQLSATKVANLRRSRDAIRDCVINYYKERELAPPNFCGQGSFKVKTGINQSDEDYDVDHGIYLQHLPEKRENWPATKTVHKEICTAVNGQTDLPVEDKQACVRVRYKKEYHVDLAIYGEYDGKIYLARKDNEQWEENSPKLFTQWFLDKLKVSGEQLRSVVKYIKKWSYYNGYIDDISGFLITILTGDHFFQYADRDDIALFETLKNIVSHLEYQRKILRPVDPKKNMTGSMSEKDMDRMITRFKDFRDSAEKATSIGSKEEAQKIWRQLFGDDFPKYVEKQDRPTSPIYTVTRENKPWGK
jgi:hypothetical protein